MINIMTTFPKSVCVSERERQLVVGVNERRFTLDQSHKLECKLEAGLQSMVEGQCIQSRFIL